MTYWLLSSKLFWGMRNKRSIFVDSTSQLKIMSASVDLGLDITPIKTFTKMEALGD